MQVRRYPTGKFEMWDSARTFATLLGHACVLLPAQETEAGYEFDAVYTADVLRNASGGLRTGTRFLDNLDLMLKVDVDDAWGFGTGTLFAYALYNNASTFSDELVGDLLVNSNIDAPGAWRVYELWYEIGGGPWSVRSGLYDLNSEFDVNESGGLFLNSAHGIGADFGQTGENGPSIFPVSSLTVRVAFEAPGYVARLAVLDGVPGDPDDPSSNEVRLGEGDGALLVGEVDVPMGDSGRAWAGYWHYTADFVSPFDGRRFDDNDGWYVGVENGFTIGERLASWFVRYGRAEDSLNALGEYIGAGIVVDGLIPARPDDEIGLAVASGRTGAAFRRSVGQSGGDAAAHETAWELTWRAPLNEHVAIQPDIQFVDNPGGIHDNDDAWIVGLRIELSY